MMDDRILLIGEAPNRSEPASTAILLGAAGHRIADLAGMTFEEYQARTERLNLLETWPGVVWPVRRARAAAEEMKPRLVGRSTLLLGQRVGAAFGWYSRLFWWTELSTPGTRVAVIPHPSSRSLWWNDAVNRAAARRFLRATFGTEE